MTGKLHKTGHKKKDLLAYALLMATGADSVSVKHAATILDVTPIAIYEAQTDNLLFWDHKKVRGKIRVSDLLNCLVRGALGSRAIWENTPGMCEALIQVLTSLSDMPFAARKELREDPRTLTSTVQHLISVYMPRKAKS